MRLGASRGLINEAATGWRDISFISLPWCGHWRWGANPFPTAALTKAGDFSLRLCTLGDSGCLLTLRPLWEMYFYSSFSGRTCFLKGRNSLWVKILSWRQLDSRELKMQPPGVLCTSTGISSPGPLLFVFF